MFILIYSYDRRFEQIVDKSRKSYASTLNSVVKLPVESQEFLTTPFRIDGLDCDAFQAELNP